MKLSNYQNDLKLKMTGVQTISIPVKGRDTLLKSFLNENYLKYSNEVMKIGMTETFPEVKKSIKDEFTITDCIKGNIVNYKVRLCQVSFGTDNKYTCTAIITDEVKIPRNGELNGFGAHGYIDEAEAMEIGVKMMAHKHNLMICTKVCSWPFAKVIVDNVTDSLLVAFKENKK